MKPPTPSALRVLYLEDHSVVLVLGVSGTGFVQCIWFQPGKLVDGNAPEPREWVGKHDFLPFTSGFDVARKIARQLGVENGGACPAEAVARVAPMLALDSKTRQGVLSK